MNVLQVGKYYAPVEGGIESHVHALAVGLSRKHQVTALVFNTGRRTVEEKVGPVHVVRVASYGRVLSTAIAPAFPGWFLRLRRADVIHLHSPNPIGEIVCLAAPRGAKLIVTYHGDVVRQRWLGRPHRLVLRRVLRRADRIVVFTRRYMESSPVLSDFRAKCCFIPHGVDLSEYESTPRVEERAARLRAEHGPRLLLFVGRLVYYKGVEVLLRALARVPDTRLLVVGDGPMRRDLEGLAARLGLGKRAVFLGRQAHEFKVACYHACDALVLPATHRSEAFGIVQVEAQACSRPVISTNLDSGVPFVNLDGVTGLVVEPGDHNGLAAAMDRLLADGALRERLGEAGRRRAEDLFSRSVMERSFLELYDGLAGEGAPGGAVTAGSRAAAR